MREPGCRRFSDGVRGPQFRVLVVLDPFQYLRHAFLETDRGTPSQQGLDFGDVRLGGGRFSWALRQVYPVSSQKGGKVIDSLRCT